MTKMGILPMLTIYDKAMCSYFELARIYKYYQDIINKGTQCPNLLLVKVGNIFSNG